MASRSRISGRSSSRLTKGSGFVEEARVVGELRALDALAEQAEEAVVRRGDHQLAVGGREDLVGDDQRERGAMAPRHDAGAAARRSAGSRRARAPVSKSATSTSRPRPVVRALEQRGEDAERGPHAGADVDHARRRRARPGRSGSPVMLIRPGERLHQRVVARAAPRAARSGRTRRSSSRRGAGFERAARRCRARAARPCPARSDWTNTSAPSTSRSSASLPALVLEVERERALRAVRCEEHRRCRPRRTAAPRRAPRRHAGMLDLDDVGAEAAEDLRAGRPGERRGQIDDANALQRREAHVPEATHRIRLATPHSRAANGADEARHEHAALVDRRDGPGVRRRSSSMLRDARLRRRRDPDLRHARSTSTSSSASGSTGWASRPSASARAPRTTARSAPTRRCGPRRSQATKANVDIVRGARRAR